MEPDSGSFRWGMTITTAYFPKENSAFFNSDLNLVEWLGQYSPPTEGESFARGFLGRMLFSGDEALKKTTVLSGGERVRCMLARMMLSRRQRPDPRRADQPPGPGIDHRPEQRPDRLHARSSCSPPTTTSWSRPWPTGSSRSRPAAGSSTR